MSTSIVSIDPEHDMRWDSFVENHPFGWVCHLTGWKRVLEKSFPHMRGHYLALLQDGRIQAALPIFEVRSWLTGHRLVSIPFATLSDPLVSSSADMQRLVDAALSFSQERGISAMEIRALHTSAHFNDSRFAGDGSFKYHYLHLDRSPEELKKLFHRSCVRQRISRSMNSDIMVREGETESDVEEFYRMYVVNRKQLGLPPQPYPFIKALWDTFHPGKQLTLLRATKNGRLVGCLMLFKFKSRVSVEFAVYDEDFLNISPLHRMFWEAMQSAHQEGFRIFDFGRTSSANQSLMDFKNRWGSTVADLHHFYYPAGRSVRHAAREHALGRKLIQKVCRVTPAPVFEGIGKVLYRHLS